MKQNKGIFNLISEHLWGMFGDDVSSYNDLYDSLLSFVTSSLISTNSLDSEQLDIAMFFLDALKSCINEVLFNEK